MIKMVTLIIVALIMFLLSGIFVSKAILSPTDFEKYANMKKQADENIKRETTRFCIENKLDKNWVEYMCNKITLQECIKRVRENMDKNGIISDKQITLSYTWK